MTTSFDEQHAEVMAEYEASAAAVRGVPDANPRDIRRHNRAMEDLFQHRRDLRLGGIYVGNRPGATEADRAAGITDEMVLGIRAVDNETEAPSL